MNASQYLKNEVTQNNQVKIYCKYSKTQSLLSFAMLQKIFTQRKFAFFSTISEIIEYYNNIVNFPVIIEIENYLIIKINL